jgi:hypothetical protein
MFKTLIRLTLLTLLLVGCMSNQSNTVSVSPDGVISRSNAPALPVIYLEFAGTTIHGLGSAYYWIASDGKSGSGAQNLVPNPPNYPSKLVAQVGQTVDIVVTSATVPPAIVVAEIDAQGIPISSSAVKPSSSRTPYSLNLKGQYILQVTAQWSWQNYVTYLFEVDIAP